MHIVLFMYSKYINKYIINSREHEHGICDKAEILSLQTHHPV